MSWHELRHLAYPPRAQRKRVSGETSMFIIGMLVGVVVGAFIGISIAN